MKQSEFFGRKTVTSGKGWEWWKNKTIPDSGRKKASIQHLISLGHLICWLELALSNLPVFKKVCAKLQNLSWFTVSQASNFYFHFISICAQYRASCNKSFLREQFPNLLNLYRGSGPQNTCTFNWLHVSNMAVQKLSIIK